MSVTTTANPVTTTLTRALRDYEIHESAEQNPEEHPAPVNSSTRPNVENPEGWPEEYHNVPNYRPVDHTRDMELRPGGMNPAETGRTKNAREKEGQILTGNSSFHLLDDERSEDQCRMFCQ
ncbi:MAG: hypothetical protein Q9165_005997 [Trypethelium subeluteriae]